jgi:hypothetical protein
VLSQLDTCFPSTKSTLKAVVTVFKGHNLLGQELSRVGCLRCAEP